jgi:hypothetical protein
MVSDMPYYFEDTIKLPQLFADAVYKPDRVSLEDTVMYAGLLSVEREYPFQVREYESQLAAVDATQFLRDEPAEVPPYVRTLVDGAMGRLGGVAIGGNRSKFGPGPVVPQMDIQSMAGPKLWSMFTAEQQAEMLGTPAPDAQTDLHAYRVFMTFTQAMAAIRRS